MAQILYVHKTTTYVLVLSSALAVGQKPIVVSEGREERAEESRNPPPLIPSWVATVLVNPVPVTDKTGVLTPVPLLSC